MAEAINCNSCGAANQLPEGKNSMFCAFCGAVIQMAPLIKDHKVINESSIKTKPQITQKKTKITQKYIAKSKYDSFTETMVDKGYFEDVEEVIDNGGELSLINRGIKSFEEISSWFSDNELTEIKKLILYNNKIENFQGLERFSRLQKLDLTNNQIADLPKENSYIKFPNELNLTGNPIANKITTEELYYYSNIQIDLGVGAEKVKEANELRIKAAKEKRESTCRVCGKEFTEKLGESRRCGKCEKAINEDQIKTNQATKENNNQPSFGKVLGNELSGGKCFIATATMGSYNHPTVLELRYFRDNWILQKSWGESFVEWYYYYGAKAAKLIEKSVLLKNLSYFLIVKPLVYLSRIVKQK